MNPVEPAIDQRSRIERARDEANERRTQALIDLRSPGNSAAMRINAWERLHQVRLPKDPAHVVLSIVARQTELELADVLEVQRQRALAAA